MYSSKKIYITLHPKLHYNLYNQLLKMITPVFDPFPNLETERLILRRIRKNDVNELFFLRSDKEVLTYLDKEPAKDAFEVSAFIEKLYELERSSSAINWAITFKENEKMIGTICIWNISNEHHRGELGYVLHPDHQCRGIMNEALKSVIEYGFQKINLHSMEANVNPYNAASIRLLEKNNFIREAYFRENFLFRSKFIDTAIYSLIVSEYLKSSGKY
jgi:ribosomal-protein-alanine N-acetyltransferase